MQCTSRQCHKHFLLFIRLPAWRVPAGCGMHAASLSESVHCCLGLAAQPLSLVTLSTQLC